MVKHKFQIPETCQHRPRSLKLPNAPQRPQPPPTPQTKKLTQRKILMPNHWENTKQHRDTIIIHLSKNHQTNTLIYLTDIYPEPMDTTPIKAENKNITDSQRQYLYKGRQMEKSSKVS